jgi:hypothetical protein
MRKLLFLMITILAMSFKSNAQYCNTSFSNASFEHITNVTFGGINNSSAGNTGGPVNYTNKIASVYYNNNHDLSVSILADMNEYVYAFIDWNQDGDFADSDETYTVASNVATSGPFVLSIATPNTALAGNTRMRVILHYGGTTPDPCVSTTYGEAEDYTVNVGAQPACFPPTNIDAPIIGINTASLSWTASLSNPTGGYQFEVRTSGNAGSGSVGRDTTGITSSITADISGLTISTTYNFYVRAICGAGDTSSWVPYTFSTTYAKPRPWLEAFDTTAVPTDWSTASWILGTSSSIPNEVTNILYKNLYSGTPNGNFTSVNVGAILAGDALTFNYQYNEYSSPYGPTAAGSGNFVVAISTDFGATYTDVATVLNDGTAGWKTFTQDLTTYAGQYIKIKVTATWISGDYYVSFDNFAVQSCMPPGNLVVDPLTLTSSFGSVSWDASISSPALGYKWELRTSGLPGSGNTGLVEAGTTNLLTKDFSALLSNTNYTFSIASKCSVTDSSTWASIMFTTPCALVSTFNESFDAAVIPNLPPCWLKIGAGNSYLSSSVSLSAPNSVYLYSSTGNIAYLRMPPVSGSDLGTHRLRFRAVSNGTVGGTIQVGYLTDPTDVATFVQIGSDFVTTSTTSWDNFVVSPVTTQTGVTTLVFKHTGSPAYAVYIDNVIYEPIPNCEEPSNVQVTNILPNTADVDWDAPTSGTPPLSYSVYYSTSDTIPSLTASPMISGLLGTSVALSGLTPATTYYVFVRSICSATDSSSWSFKKSFTSACIPVTTLPWSENFEGLSTVGASIVPSCWNLENVSGTVITSASTPVYNGIGARSGTKYLWSRYGTNNWMYAPAIQLTAGQSYDFSFYYVNTTATAGFVINVAWGTNPAIADMVNPLGTITDPINTSYTQAKYTFTPSTTGVYYFGVQANGNFAPWYLCFDDFKVELTPSCNEPTAVTVSNITTNTAEVSWTAPIAGTPPLSYSIYHSTSNTAPALNAAPTVSGITSTTGNLTGLTASTVYYVWVRSICSSTDSSSWTLATQFTTQCDAVNTYPYSEGFNTVGVLPVCWTAYEGASGASQHWKSVAADASHGPSTAAEGAAFMSMNYYNATQAYNPYYLKTIPFALGATAKQAKFSIWMGSASGTDNLIFEASTDGGTTWTTLATYTANPANNSSSSPWENKVVDLSAYMNQTVIFRLNATSNYGSGFCNVAFDNFVVQNVPSCNEPTAVTIGNVTTTSADVSWTAPVSGTPPLSYSIYYSTTNTTPALTASPNVSGVTGLTSPISGLTPAATYYVWVRSICSTTDSSNWSNIASLTTACVPVSVPYSENFNSTSGSSLPLCTAVENAGAGNVWATASSPGYGFNSRVLQYSYNSSNAADVWFYTSPLTLQGGVTYELSYIYGNNSTTYTEKMNVFYGASAAYASMTELLANHDNINSGDSAINVVAFTPLTTGVYYIGFHAYSQSDQYYLYLDDITVSQQVLPVTFTQFTGKKEGSVNVLSWQTATEMNNIGFELERSADGKNFTKLSFVNTKANNGNSNQVLNYAYNDIKPLAGNNYYRLKQLDKDGKFNFSNVVLLYAGKVNQVSIASVYPNPVRNMVNVQIVSPSNEKVSLVITDITGKILIQKNTVISTGDNSKQVDVTSLSQGSYIIKVVCANGCESAAFKFTKY